jgi:hypothetical protein
VGCKACCAGFDGIDYVGFVGGLTLFGLWVVRLAVLDLMGLIMWGLCRVLLWVVFFFFFFCTCGCS